MMEMLQAIGVLALLVVVSLVILALALPFFTLPIKDAEHEYYRKKMEKLYKKHGLK